MKEALKGILKGIAYFVYYVVVTLIIQFTISFGITTIGANKGLTDEQALINFVNNNFLIMTGLSGLLVALFMVVIIKINHPEIQKEIKLTKLKALDVVKSCLATLSLAFGVYLCTYERAFENNQKMIQSFKYYYDDNQVLGVVFLVLAFLIIAPISEEIALRGVVYTRIEKAAKPIWAIIISASLFGLMHFLAGGWELVIVASIMGIVLGLIFYKTQSLLVCVFAHMVANIPDLVFINNPELSGGTKNILISLCGVVFVLSLIWILRSKTENKN